MSNNYYLVARGVPDDVLGLHIGKTFASRAGRSFIFEGHFRYTGELNREDITPYWRPDPGKFEPWLTSAKEWFAYLREQVADGKVVRGESGVNRDVDHFIEMIDEMSPSARRIQYDWVDARRHEYGAQLDKIEPGGTWLDEDGYSFSGSDFC